MPMAENNDSRFGYILMALWSAFLVAMWVGLFDGIPKRQFNNFSMGFGFVAILIAVALSSSRTG